MSQSFGGARLTDYRAALSAPGSREPVVASLFARLPIAMIGISALLYVQRQTGSFTTAGLVSASTLAGVSVGSVVQGRLIDRCGPTRPLLAVAALFTLLLAALVVAIESRAATPVLAVMAAGIGVSEPMTGSASRALWARLLPPGPARDAALSYEAISMEVFFILGPGLAGALTAAPWAGTGLVFGAACMVVGSVLFALSPAVRAWGPADERPSRLLGALASPGLRTLALAAGGFGMVIGFVEVAVPAAASAAGSVVTGGLLLSLWSVSSVGFGLAYSMRPWPRSLHLRLPVLLAVFGAGVALLAVPSSLWGLGLALLVAGALITPQSTAHSVAIELVAPRGTAAEAFGWVVTAITLGLAFGQSVSGYLVERSGPPLAFLTAAACATVVAGAVWLLRSTIRTTEPLRPGTEPVAC
ncbi:MFS family permease [Saccharomonospora amisosensis]|uniref:MFS family permease n=1 Tax=Saccharomonospora amisosensis TaxID=1128677 RepID=A0A7X5ZPA7_9PSEU|nr:MFS transporter [Saccharomonospora amisosensis]NIJ10030.1 MFS family permease [Saccharomonospora amisosensis]